MVVEFKTKQLILEMIQQAGVGLASREDANPYYDSGYLPLIAAPMSAVVGDYFPTVLDKHKIQYVMPRNYRPVYSDKWFTAISLEEFEQLIQRDIDTTIKVCIDVANGNNPRLHAAIREAKEKHGDRIYIISGNVGSVEAFAELAKSGCDAIRVGIGGSSGCNTSTQTGVGQYDLAILIYECNNRAKVMNLSTVIIADGITTYVNKLISKQECLENGYAAINKLLYAGASYVMLGKIFAQCVEADTNKTVMHRDYYIDEVRWVTEFAKGDSTTINEILEKAVKDNKLYADYYGMASIRGQKTYLKDVKPSEGKSIKIPVKWTLEEWLHGNNTDELPGYINMLKSAMSYTGSKTLNEFIW